MPKGLQIVAAIILILFGAALVVIIQKASGLSPSPAKEMSYAEFTGVILTALGVILAALTIFLGVIAFYGWASFESLVEKNTNNYLQDRFGTSETPTSDTNDMREVIRQELALASRTAPEQENQSPFDEDQL